MSTRILMYNNQPITGVCSTEESNSVCSPQGSCAIPQLFLQVPPNAITGQALVYENGNLVWRTLSGFVDPVYSTSLSDI